MSLSSHSPAAKLLHIFRQGVTPGKLAFAIALGVGLSCFPVFGTTTILCTIVALAFRLNLPAIQVGNYLALPLQLALFFPFLRLGERLFHAPAMSLSPQQLLTMAKTSPNQMARVLLSGQWHAIAGWALVAPEMVFALILILRPIVGWFVRRAAGHSTLPGRVAPPLSPLPAASEKPGTACQVANKRVHFADSKAE